MSQIIINSLEECKQYKNELSKIKVWVCNTACGKSYLSKIDDRFYDLDKCRSNFKHQGFDNYEDSTIPKMQEISYEGRIVLNAAHGHFLKYLTENEIPFVYMYGKPEVQDEYIVRMRQRGSSEEFINKFGTIIAEHYPHRAQDKRGTFKIEMNPKEYVSDYVWLVFGEPETCKKDI